MVIKPLRLTVLTLAETLLDVEEVVWVRARLVDGGGISVYPGHAPLLAETVTAPLRYANGLGEHVLDLEAGILQVDRDGVTIFTSGPVQASKVSGSLKVPDGTRFDRLARTLLTAMPAQPAPPLGGKKGGAGDEEE